MNYNFRCWFFLCRFFLMIHICSFCARKGFDSNAFLMFHRFGDDITVYVLPAGFSENYKCRSFRFGGCNFFDNYLGLHTITILRLTWRVTNQILLFIMLVSFIIYDKGNYFLRYASQKSQKHAFKSILVFLLGFLKKHKLIARLDLKSPI